MGQVLALRPVVPQIVDPADEFEIHDLSIFERIPSGRDFGIVALHGKVVVYDSRPLSVEGVVEGAFYVRERQAPAGCRPWRDWVQDEFADACRRAGPGSPLITSREVVQAVRWPRDKGENSWAVRLSSGFTDGPYYDWWFGRDFVGKVVGIYRPI